MNHPLNHPLNHTPCSHCFLQHPQSTSRLIDPKIKDKISRLLNNHPDSPFLGLSLSIFGGDPYIVSDDCLDGIARLIRDVYKGGNTGIKCESGSCIIKKRIEYILKFYGEKWEKSKMKKGKILLGEDREVYFRALIKKDWGRFSGKKHQSDN